MITNYISKQIWEDRYRKNNESLSENISRVANYISLSKDDYSDFHEIMSKGWFLPAGRTMSNSGIGENLTLNNCFIEGHKVLTRDEGFKNIENIKIGDYVLTEKNTFERVNNVMPRDYEGDLYEITPLYSIDKITCTPNHKFLTDNRGWVKAEDLKISCADYSKKSDFLKLIKHEQTEEKVTTIDIVEYLGDEINNIKYDEEYVWTETKYKNPNSDNFMMTKKSKKVKRFIQFDADMSYLVGNWLGDGFTSYSNKTDNSVFGIVFNVKEFDRKDKLKEIINKKFGIEISEYTNPKQNTNILRVTNTFIGNLFVKMCGLHNENKKIPTFLLQNNKIGLNMLLGLLDSDGTVNKQGNVLLVLKNNKLIEQVKHLSFILGLYCNSKERRGSYVFQNGEKSLAHEIRYDIHSSNKIKESLNKIYSDDRLNKVEPSSKTFRLSNGNFYTRIKSINVIKNSKVKVYNLSVENIHSYNVNGVVAHNCFTLNLVPDSMEGIFECVKYGALTQKAGGKC